MKNNKGFMMAEVIVVSAIVMVALTGMYISYNKIYKRYNEVLNYYDATSIYRAAYYRDALIENNKINELLGININDATLIYRKDSEGNAYGEISTLGESEVDGYDSDTVFLVHNGKKNLDINMINNINAKAVSDINVTFQDYLEYVKESVNLKNTNYVMLIERCKTEDDCKYGYLEINDGQE